MNKWLKISVVAVSALLVFALAMIIFSCKKNESTPSEDNDQSVNDENQSDIQIEVNDGTVNDDGSVDIEVNLGDYVNNGNNNYNPINPDDGVITYEEYWSWTAEEREAYYNSFDSVDDFFAWYNEILQEYNDRTKPPVIDGNGNIDLGGN